MNNKKSASPKLRFAEFANRGEVIFENGDTLFEAISDKDHDCDLPVLAITQEQGAIPREMIDYQVFVTDKSLESYKKVEVGDFIISLRSFQGGIEYSSYQGICSPAYIILRKKKNIVNEYYKYYFKSKRFIQDLNRNLEGIRDGKMVSYEQFSQILIPKPNNDEQKVIANCIESLDTLIGVENNKLNALKRHKIGLMQKLFPTKNQDSPAYRFCEFSASGSWKYVKLSDVADRVISKNKDNSIQRVFTNSANNGVMEQSKYFEREIVTENNLSNYSIIENGDYVYNPRISTVAPVGPISKNKIGKGIISPLYMVFRFRKDDHDFYEYYFKTTLWHQYINGKANMGARHDRINISTDDFMNMPVPVCPNPKEQERIALFFKSVDELIIKQEQKVEELNRHKEGLLQQLFPSFEEVNK